MMRHPGQLLSFIAFIAGQILAGAYQVARDLVDHRATPAIVEFPLRCRTDVEVSVLTACITMTPGTLVLGVAPAHQDQPATLFVHSMFGTGRDEIRAGLRTMEDRLLRATRGRQEEP